MTALYNEIDAYAADWLENLIAAGHIAPGVVDRRSIEEIEPDYLRGFRQVHFFAGIGVWSLALRRAGVPDDAPVWTGSCPCQPFSAAGKGGGMDDERHLWPAFHHLIRECRPPVVFGEQVASKDGLAWLDLVSSDLEGSDYAFGSNDLCAAGFGAPHIRQRLFWVGTDGLADVQVQRGRVEPRRLPRATSSCERTAPGQGNGNAVRTDRTVGRMDDDDDARLEGFGGGYQAESGRRGTFRPTTATSEPGRMADDNGGQLGKTGTLQCNELDGFLPHDGGALWERRGRIGHNGGPSLGGSGPTDGFWRDADWLHCRDGRWRPVEPGTFPLAHGAPSRVGRLRAYGNAIVEEVARNFIECAIESIAAGTVSGSDGWELIG